MVKKRISKLFLRVVPAFVLLVSERLLVAEPAGERVSAAFEKLPLSYTVSYGDPTAGVHVTEYFSLSCPKCLEFIRKDFPFIQSKYIDTGKIYWTFHPDPADILTLQAMVCFELLEESEKQSLLEALSKEAQVRGVKKACFKMQEKMKDLGKPLSYLHDLSYLEKTEAFQVAYLYLKQPNVPVELPTIEINGMLYEEFPSRSWTCQIISRLLKGGDESQNLQGLSKTNENKAAPLEGNVTTEEYSNKAIKHANKKSVKKEGIS